MKQAALFLILASGAVAQAIFPLGPGIRVLTGGGSNIAHTPGGKCEGAASNTCDLDEPTPASGVPVLIAAISSDGQYTGQAMSCDADGTPMVHLQYFQSPDTNARNVDLWYLKNAPGGLVTISCVLFSGTSSSFFAQWYLGSNSVDPVDDVCTGATASPCTITTSVDDALLFAVGIYAAGAPDACAGFTVINEINNVAQSDVQNMGATTAGSYPITGCGFFAFFTAWIVAAFI